MDFYAYYTERLGWDSNPYVAVAGCQQIVVELLNNPRIPFHIAATAAVDLLAALADFAGNGCAVTAVYEGTMEALIDILQQMRDTTAAANEVWRLERNKLEQEAGGGSPYIPDEYEVWPVDMDTGENGEDDPDEEEPDEDEPREPSGILEAIRGIPLLPL